MNKIIIGILSIIVLLLGALVYVQYQNGQKVKAVNELARQALQQMASARQKGNEAYFKAQMYSIRPEAEILFDEFKSYSPICKNGLLNDGLPRITPYVSEILKKLGVADQSLAGIECVSSTQSYAISIKVDPPIVFEPLAFCIDSNGYAGTGTVAKTNIVCATK